MSDERARAETLLNAKTSFGTVWASHARDVARDVLSLVERLETAEKERDEAHFAHLALDDFDAPREEPHFRSPYQLAGRIRWLRSKLIIDANQRAGKLEARALAAEERAERYEGALRKLADADWNLVNDGRSPGLGLTFREFARAALPRSVPQEEEEE